MSTYELCGCRKSDREQRMEKGWKGERKRRGGREIMKWVLERNQQIYDQNVDGKSQGITWINYERYGRKNGCTGSERLVISYGWR